MRTVRRMLLVVASAGAVVAAAFGCGGGAMRFAGQSATLQSGTQVNFQDAVAEDDDLEVKLWVANMTQAFMMVDRDGFGLRLPDGRVLRREGAIHNVYNLPPGSGHAVFVKFTDPGHDMRHLEGASLIVGGISFSTDPRPRVVGEIPLVPSGPHG